MPHIKYIDKRFSGGSLDIIDRANNIIEDYLAQGYKLTLRQLYYQFVARDLIPNRQSEYKRLGSILGDARMAGIIDWNAIEDRTRSLRRNSHWDSPADILESAASSFQFDKWADQKCRPEVWIEKDALVGVIEGVCSRLDISYFSCRGYGSLSEMWSAGQRLLRYMEAGQTPVILHFGDHDPSGKDMTRDITDRLETFSGGVEVQRLALNMDQVETYNPPPNPAKTTDSRYKAYIRQFGPESWELDALEPAVLVDLIESNVEPLRDDEKWNAMVERENSAKQDIQRIADEWEDG